MDLLLNNAWLQSSGVGVSILIAMFMHTPTLFALRNIWIVLKYYMVVLIINNIMVF